MPKLADDIRNAVEAQASALRHGLTTALAPLPDKGVAARNRIAALLTAVAEGRVSVDELREAGEAEINTAKLALLTAQHTARAEALQVLWSSATTAINVLLRVGG